MSDISNIMVIIFPKIKLVRLSFSGLWWAKFVNLRPTHFLKAFERQFLTKSRHKATCPGQETKQGNGRRDDSTKPQKVQITIQLNPEECAGNEPFNINKPVILEDRGFLMT
jgi:hypothetical protein